jgi:hypothetical protein
MNSAKLLSLLCCFMTLSVGLFAHPGHGTGQSDPHGIFHYLSSLEHLIPLLTVLGLILFAIMKKRAASKRVIRK